jgi:polyisoprenoid-binding protein YceI
VLQLDPAQTHVQFTLSDVLHTVRGGFKLKRGMIRYDFTTGTASGEIVIDAQSGDSGSGARDKRMHRNVLESDRFPEIAFVPDHVEGSLAQAKVHGMFRIHGQDHEMTMEATATPTAAGLEIRERFTVPYVKWGMKDPGTFVLKVGDTVTIDVTALGRTQ